MNWEDLGVGIIKISLPKGYGGIWPSGCRNWECVEFFYLSPKTVKLLVLYHSFCFIHSIKNVNELWSSRMQKWAQCIGVPPGLLIFFKKYFKFCPFFVCELICLICLCTCFYGICVWRDTFQDLFFFFPMWVLGVELKTPCLYWKHFFFLAWSMQVSHILIRTARWLTFGQLSL